MTPYSRPFLIAALTAYAIAFVVILFLGGCSDSDKPSASISDTSQTYSPEAMDDDDAILNDQAESASSAVAKCRTYYSTRMNSGRRLWKINNPPWRKGTYASVRFNSGFSVGRVLVGKANRINSGRGRGFVFRPGQTTNGIIAIWSPYSDKSTQVTVCGR